MPACTRPGLLFCLLLVLSLPATAQGSMMQLTTELESFRLDSSDKLSDLYTLRGVYLDNANAAATEAVQIFISEIRTNIFLVNNVLDLVFLYSLHKEYDDKQVVGEYVASRMREIINNVRYNIERVNDLAVILGRQGQQTLASDYYDYRSQLVMVADTIRDMVQNIDQGQMQNSE